MPWWWTISPYLVCYASSGKFPGVHQENMTFFSGWGRAGLTCSDIHTFLRFTTLPLFTTADCGNSCCSNVSELNAYVQNTEHCVFQKPWSDPVVHNLVTSTNVFNGLTLWPVSGPFLLVWKIHLLQQDRGAELLNSFQNKPHLFLYLTLFHIKQQACFQGPLLNQL